MTRNARERKSKREESHGQEENHSPPPIGPARPSVALRTAVVHPSTRSPLGADLSSEVYKGKYSVWTTPYYIVGMTYKIAGSADFWIRLAIATWFDLAPALRADHQMHGIKQEHERRYKSLDRLE